VDKFSLRNEYRVVISAGASGGLGRAAALRNGGQLHLEAADHPEYVTPACATVPDLVVHDKAGDRILEGLLTGDIRVFKAGAGGSFGCQEDYLIGRRGEFGRLADILIPFLVTRQLICGTGSFDGAVYCLSRPAVATRPRPLISTRDEALAAAAGMRRLRVRVSDPTMSETTTLLKAGATELVLRMAEAGGTLPDATLDNPVQAMSEVSRDITGRYRLRLARGREMSALDIQRGYLAAAREFTDGRGADAVTTRVLGLWERALDAIGTGNLDAIAREIDWVIKYQLIEQERAARGVPRSAPEIAEADLAYHDINRRRGLYYQLQRAGKVERTARDIDIFEAKTVPPAPGRYRQAG